MSVHRVAALVSTTIVVTAVIAGLIIAGTPSEQRLVRFDRERVADLRQLAQLIRVRAQEQQILPSELTALVDGVTLRRLPLDPSSGVPYEYAPDPACKNFELCASFARASVNSLDDFWSHPAGRHCYAFEVSPKLEDARRTPALPAPGIRKSPSRL